jgi:hypothetical protein
MTQTGIGKPNKRPFKVIIIIVKVVIIIIIVVVVALIKPKHNNSNFWCGVWKMHLVIPLS